MRIFLRELVNPNNTVLSDTQKSILILCKISPSPEAAYESTSISQNLTEARESLVKLGMVQLTPNSVSLTPPGEELLVKLDLVDEMGELTEEGNKILESIKDVTSSYVNQPMIERFDFLKSLL